MKDLDERLSRWLDGDLPPDEAEALRRRVADEPEVAAAYAAMRALRADLDAIPESAPPAALDAAVLERATGARTERRSLRRLVPALALVAGLLIGVGLGRTAPSQVWLERGSQWVDGEALVHAGDVAVQIDGKARVTVEPLAGVARASRGEEDPMNPLPHLASAAVGAAITVAVYEGTAVLRSEGREPVTVSAGERRVIEPSAPPAVAPAVSWTPAVTAPPEEAPQAPVDPAAEIARLKFENALYRGQLAQLQGEAQPWPEKVPAHLEPAAFEATVRAGAEAAGLGPVVGLDCDEYPCIAFVEIPDGLGIDAVRPATEVLGGFVTGDDRDARLWQMVAIEDDGEHAGGMIALSVLPPDGEGTGDNQRVGYRAEGFMQAWSEP